MPGERVPPWDRDKGFDYPPGSWGVLCQWEYGNLVNTLGRRLAVSGRYPTGRFIDWFLETQESASHAHLQELGDVRYLVIDANTISNSFPGAVIQSGRDFGKFQVVEDTSKFQGIDLSILSFGKEFRRSVGARLYLGDGSGMGRYRLVYESPEFSFLRYRAMPDIEYVELASTSVTHPSDLEFFELLTETGNTWVEDEEWLCYSGALVAEVKIFERVAGARIEGTLPRSESVTLTLDLRSPLTNRRWQFVRTAETSAGGSFQFVVPYPTGPSTDGATIFAPGPYRVSGSENPYVALEFEVSPEAIRHGETVSGKRVVAANLRKRPAVPEPSDTSSELFESRSKRGDDRVTARPGGTRERRNGWRSIAREVIVDGR